MLERALKNENCISSASRYIVHSGAPVATDEPFCTQIEPIVPGVRCADFVLHLHRFQDKEDVARLNLLARRAADVEVVPGIGAATVSPPVGVAGAGAGARGRSRSGCGRGLGRRCCCRASPTGVPVTVPRSTMTSYCLPLSVTMYFIVVFPLKLP